MIKLYLDEDVRSVLAQALRQRGIDATSAVELNHRKWTDEEQLIYASAEKRTIITYNIKDFVRLHQK